MDHGELHRLLPDLDGDLLSRAIERPALRSALEDLDVTLKELARCPAGTRDRSDWEETRDELLAEVRRLALRQAQKP